MIPKDVENASKNCFEQHSRVIAIKHQEVQSNITLFQQEQYRDVSKSNLKSSKSPSSKHF